MRHGIPLRGYWEGRGSRGISVAGGLFLLSAYSAADTMLRSYILSFEPHYNPMRRHTIVPNLQLKTGIREVKRLAQGHTAAERQT